MDVHLDAAQVLARFDALQQSGEDLLFTPRQTVIRRTHRGFDVRWTPFQLPPIFPPNNKHGTLVSNAAPV